MAAPDWVKLYPARFLSGVTAQLTMAELGVYALLVLLIDDKGEAIRDDPAWLARMLRHDDPRRKGSASPRALRAAINTLIDLGKVWRLEINGEPYLMAKRCAESIAEAEHNREQWAKNLEHSSRASEPAVNPRRKRDEPAMNPQPTRNQPTPLSNDLSDLSSPSAPPAYALERERDSKERSSQEVAKKEASVGTIPVEPRTAAAPPAAPNPTPKGNAHDKPKPAARGSRIPTDWQPDEKDRRYAADHGLDPNTIAEEFRDWWAAAAGAKAVKRDWHATWRTWCRRAEQQPGGRAAAPLRGHAATHAGFARAAARLERQRAGDDQGDDDTPRLAPPGDDDR